MNRIHLFEFEDLRWFPDSIRNYMTDFLQFVSNTFNFYRPITPMLKKGLDSIESNRIIDLASGGGGGWTKLCEQLEQDIPHVNIHLTDYYPNIRAFKRMESLHPEMISYSMESINALDVPKRLIGLRTQFLSFHHFRKKDAIKILQNAVDAKQPIAIFEAQRRSISYLLKFFLSPVHVILVTPFIRPFSMGRILFTYIIPIVPICTWWDGLVSVLRTYSEDELRYLIKQVNNSNDFNWEISSVKGGQIKIYYLLGIPL